MLEPSQLLQHCVFEVENVFALVLLLHLQRHVLLQIFVVGLVDEAECSLAELLFYDEAVRYFKCFFQQLLHRH